MVEEENSQGRVINQPAGHLEPNESLQEAAIRETIEETGWTVALDGIVGIGLYTAPANQLTYQRITFFGRAEQHHPERTLDDGIIQALWLDYEEIQAESARMRSPLVIDVIDRYRAGQRYPLDMLY